MNNVTNIAIKNCKALPCLKTCKKSKTAPINTTKAAIGKNIVSLKLSIKVATIVSIHNSFNIGENENPIITFVILAINEAKVLPKLPVLILGNKPVSSSP